MKYKIILKSGASFELELSVDQAEDFSTSIIVRDHVCCSKDLYYENGFIYSTVDTAEIVAMVAIEEDED